MSVPNRTWAFLDEYGNVNLDIEKSGVTTYFVIVAILVPAEGVQQLRVAVDDIRRTHCGDGALRSKKLAKNPSRYFEVLQSLCQTSFRFCALAVDKREIDRNSGLIYGQPFYKFLQRIVYRQLFSTYEQLTIRADEYGDTEFMAGFHRYLMRERSPQLDLFGQATVEFTQDAAEPLIQLADVVAGALGRALEPKHAAGRFASLLDLLRSHAMSIEEWPARSVARQVDRPDRLEKDSAVARLAEQRAETFVEKNVEETAADVVAQIRILKRLLFEARFGENDRYVSTNELQDFLATTFGGQYPTEWMRASVIAPLRDSGVLIASSPRGYKIPTSIADLQSFVAHADRVITPMAQRLRIARDAVRMLTHGEVDILGGESYVVLARAVDALASLRRDSP